MGAGARRRGEERGSWRAGGRAGWARVSHGPGGVARGSASDARGRRLRRPSRLCSLRRRRAGRAVSRRGRGALPAGLPVRRCSADGRGRGKGAARDPATARAVQLLLVTCSCMQNVVGELGGTRTACGVCCAAEPPSVRSPGFRSPRSALATARLLPRRCQRAQVRRRYECGNERIYGAEGRGATGDRRQLFAGSLLASGTPPPPPPPHCGSLSCSLVPAAARTCPTVRW